MGAEMYITTTGLILREVPYKESSRILTVLTAAEGKITVQARGAKRKGSKTAASTQLLAYSEMTLYNSAGRWTLTEARSIELFSGLRDDLEKISIGAYFAEVLEAVSDEDSPNPEMLSLGLNSLYALSESKHEADIIKAVFELKMMCLAGFEPALERCAVCGKDVSGGAALEVVGGVIRCAECAKSGLEMMTAIKQGTLEAMRYVCRAPIKKIFSFKIGDETARELSFVCEQYLITQLDRGFKTLDFYKSVKI